MGPSTFVSLVFRPCGHSPPPQDAVGDDGQGKDEHAHAEADGHQLLQLRQSVAVIAKGEAALPLEGGRAATGQKGVVGWGTCEHIPEVSMNQHVERSTGKFYSNTSRA